MNKIWNPFLHIVLFFTNSCKAAFQYEWSVHSSRCLQNMKPISSHGSLLHKFLQGWFQVMIFAFQNFFEEIFHIPITLKFERLILIGFQCIQALNKNKKK
jgi:hypothetical protein